MIFGSGEIESRLQWGRGLLTPEMAALAALSSGGTSLQWGRGLLTPEIWLGELRAVIRGRASMGPGSFDPGNATDDMGRLQRRQGFNGAGVF